MLPPKCFGGCFEEDESAGAQPTVPAHIWICLARNGRWNNWTSEVPVGRRTTKYPVEIIVSRCFSEDDSLSNLDSLAILDCYFSGATREHHPRTARVLSASGKDETCRSRSAKYISFSQRFRAAAISLQQQRLWKPITTLDVIFEEISRQKHVYAPDARLNYLGGTEHSIALAFKNGGAKLSLQAPQQTVSAEYQLLVRLSVAGEQDEDSQSIAERFKETLETLLSHFHVEIVSAFESTSVLFLLKMSYATFARLSSTTELTVVGPVRGRPINCYVKKSFLMRMFRHGYLLRANPSVRLLRSPRSLFRVCDLMLNALSPLFAVAFQWLYE